MKENVFLGNNSKKTQVSFVDWKKYSINAFHTDPSFLHSSLHKQGFLNSCYLTNNVNYNPHEIKIPFVLHKGMKNIINTCDNPLVIDQYVHTDAVYN